MSEPKERSRVYQLLRQQFPNEAELPDEEIQAMEVYGLALADYYIEVLRDFRSNREQTLDEMIDQVAQETETDKEDAADYLRRSACAMLGDEHGGGLSQRSRDMLLSCLQEAKDCSSSAVTREEICQAGIEGYLNAAKAQKEPGDTYGLMASSFYHGVLRVMSTSLAMVSLPCVLLIMCTAVYAACSGCSGEKQGRLGQQCMEALTEQQRQEAQAMRKAITVEAGVQAAVPVTQKNPQTRLSLMETTAKVHNKTPMHP